MKLRVNWKKQLKARKKSSKASGGVKPNHAQPARHSPADPIRQKYAAADQGHENRFSCKASAGAGAGVQRPSLRGTAEKGAREFDGAPRGYFAPAARSST